MIYLKNFILYLSMFIGIKQAPKDCRYIFLKDGRRVAAPLKPSKLEVQYSIIHDENIDFSLWIEYIRLRKIEFNSKTIKMWYL